MENTVHDLINEYLYNLTFGKYNGNDFAIIDGWREIEEFMYAVLETAVDKEIIDKYYGGYKENRIEYGNLRIGRIVDGKETSPYLVPDEITNKLKETNIINDDVKHPELGDILKCDWGFSDEYAKCDHCQEIIRTAPNSYGWKADHVIMFGEIFCGDCVRQEENLSREYINEIILNNARHPNTILSQQYFKDKGYQLYNGEYKGGLHFGRDYSDPEEQLEKISKEYENIIFDVTSVAQFETAWNVWVKNRKINSVVV